MFEYVVPRMSLRDARMADLGISSRRLHTIFTPPTIFFFIFFSGGGVGFPFLWLLSLFFLPLLFFGFCGCEIEGAAFLCALRQPSEPQSLRTPQPLSLFEGLSVSVV